MAADFKIKYYCDTCDSPREAWVEVDDLAPGVMVVDSSEHVPEGWTMDEAGVVTCYACQPGYEPART
jgi:hypothetical protein